MSKASPQLPFRELRLLAFMIVVLLTFVWSLVGLSVISSKRNAELNDRHELEAINKLVAEQVLRAVTAVDYTLNFTSVALATDPSLGRVGHLVKSGTIRLDTLVLLSHVDANGALIETNKGIVEPRIDLADREHIRSHLDRKVEGLFIGKPVKGRASGKWSIQLTRPIHGPDRDIRGVVVASMDPAYFEQFWQKALPSRGYRFELVGTDGVIRASSRDAEELLSSGSTRPEVARLAAEAKSGFIEPATDTQRRAPKLSRFQSIEGLSLILVTTIEEDAEATLFSANTMPFIMLGATGSIALLIVAQLLARRSAQLFSERRDALVARQRLRDAIDAIPEGFALFDRDDRLVIFNSAYQKIYATSQDIIYEGTTFEEILRKGAERGQYPQALGRTDDWIAARMQAHRNPHEPFEQMTDHGRWLRIEERRTHDGGIAGIRADITELKQREIVLAQQTSLLTATFEHMSEGLTVTDQDGRIVAFNQRFANIANAPESVEIKGYKLTELLAIFGQCGHTVPQDVNGDGERAYNDSIRSPGRPVEWLTPHDRIVEVTSSRLPDGGVVTVYNDVTESRAYAHRVAASEAQKSAMIAASLDAIVITNQRGVIREFNAAAEQIFGWKADEVLGQSILDLIIPDAARESTIQQLLELGANVADCRHRQRIELTARDKNGRIFPTEVTFAEILVGGNRSYSAFIRDISLRRQIETETRQAREEAEAANKAKSEFLAIVSHEVRTPMNGIIGLTGLLLGTRLDREQLQFTRGIQESADRLLILTNEILEFSRLEAGRLQISPAPFDIRQLLESTVATTRVLVGGKPVTVQSKLDTSANIWLEGDATRIHQVTYNLLANSAKFTDAGEIVLRAACLSRDDGRKRLRVEVTDTGPGIALDVQARLFTPFEQGASSVARRYGGSGLGLAICRRLIDLMDGQIGCESRLGHGARFWFEIDLPEASAPALDISQLNTLDAVQTAHALDVLVAEDTPTSQLVIRSMLQKMGHRVRVVADGAEAVAALATSAFDLVLMDLQMPVMDGIEATRRIRQLPAPANATPVVALTAQADAETCARVLAAGMNAHLTKPVTPESLRAHLSQAETLALAKSSRDAVASPPPAPTRAALTEPPPQSRRGNDQLLDAEAFAAMREAVGKDVFQRLLIGLKQDSQDALDRLAAILSTGDDHQIAQTAHKLTGLFSQFGLSVAAELAEAVETAPIEQRRDLGQKLVDIGRASIAIPELKTASG